MKPLYRLYRRSLTIIWTAAALVLVLVAVIAGMAELLLPYADRYQTQVEARLSKFVGQPVRFDSLAGSWDVTGPEFEISGLSVYADDADQGAPELVVEHARVKFSLLNYLFPNRPFYEFEIVGAELLLLRDADGVLKLSGLSSDKPMDISELLTLFSSIEIMDFTDVSLQVKDAISGFSMTFNSSLAQVQYANNEIVAGWHAQLAKDNSAFSLDALVGELAGEMDGSLSLHLEESVPQSLRVYVSSKINQPDQFLSMFAEDWRQTAKGEIEAEAWLEWQAGEPLQLSGNLAATGLEWQLAAEDIPVKLDELSTDWRLHWVDNQHWSIALAKLSAVNVGQDLLQGEVLLMVAPDAETSMHLQTGQADLAFAQSLLRPLASKLNWQYPWLATTVNGQLENLSLELDNNNQLSSLSLLAKQVSIQGNAEQLSLGPLDVKVNFARAEGVLSLSATNAELNWPTVFSQRQHWDKFECQLDFNLTTAAQLQLKTQLCELENVDVSLGLELSLLMSEGEPVVDAQVLINHLSAASLKKYWPDQVMSKRSISWLNPAFSIGEVRGAQIQLLGKLSEFPFRDGNGIFSARIPAYNMSLEFNRNWPNLEKTDAVVTFDNLLMRVQAKTSTTNGIEISSASAKLDFRDKLIIDIKLDEQVQAEELMAYLQASPLEEIMNLSLKPVQISGPAKVKGRLIFYMDGRKEWFDVSGQVALKSASLFLPDWRIQLDKLNGVLDWSEHGVSVTEMTAKLGAAEARINLLAGPEKAAGNILQAQLQTVSTVNNLMPPDLRLVDKIDHYLAGATSWDIGITIEERRPDGSMPLYLDLESDLQGMAMNFPAPLHKLTEDSWPVKIHIPLQGPDRQLVIKFMDRLGLRASLDKGRGKAESIRVLLGDDTVGEPRKGYFDLGGVAAEFNLDGWVGILSTRAASQNNLAIAPGNLAFEAAQLGFLGRQIANTRLEINYLNDSYEAVFSGPSISGRIRLPGGGRKALVADFDRLILPVSEDELPTLELNPAELPPMHLYAREFGFGHLSLKETRIETYPVKGGLRFETLEGNFNTVHLIASGDWMQTPQGGQHSQFNLHISAETIDELMQALDFDAGVTGGQSMIDFDGGWDDSPIAFTAASLNGSLELSVRDGRLIDADPGAGRLLGLISLQALPRRLMFDFRDVFKQGFSFDSAKGKFEIENGVIHITNMKVKSPAAEMLIYGATDMNKRKYDQLIRVRPGVGATLPVLGAIAGGPGGAAAGLALQTLFRKALGKAAEAVYTVTGSWDDPVITQLNKEEMRKRDDVSTAKPKGSKNR